MKRMIASVLSVLSLLLVLTACGGGTSSESSTEEKASTEEVAEEETEPATDEAEEAETTEEEEEDASSESSSEIVVVTSGGGLPHSYMDESGEWTGLDADVWDEIGERTGYTITPHQTSFDSIFGELTAGRANVASNGLGITDERTENYDPSIPYYASTYTFGVNETNGEINTFDDLAGKKVAIESGGASEQDVRDLGEEIGFEVITYEDSAAALNDLGLGRIDAFANDEAYIRNYVDETGADIKTLEEKISASNCGFFYQKDDEDAAALREEIDTVIQEMLDDGTLADLTTEWLGGDMTQYIQ